MRLHGPRSRKQGAYVVELALVIGVCLLFLFGIFEYGRYLMVVQTVTNAAREGARFAAVTTNDPNANPTGDVQTYTVGCMAGVDQQLTDSSGNPFNATTMIEVFKCDSALNPLDVNGNIVTPWTQAPYTNAGFGQTIAVIITGNFTPNLPGFFQLGATIPVNATAVMYSEAN